MVEWIIHLKNGSTLTDKDVYPSDVPSDQITSVERIISGRAYTICGSPALHNFFVKTTASKVLPLYASDDDTPTEILERIIGCFVVSGPTRIELCIDPNTGNCKLVATPVKVVTKDGF